MPKAVFLDRDGTLIEEVNYLSDFSQIKIYPFAYDAVKILNKLNFLVFIITNQSGVGRGYFSENFVKETNRIIIDDFNNKGALISDFFYCPHHPDNNCNCRKPNIGMIEKAVAKYNIELSSSFIIGDSDKDVQTGINAGIFPIQVLTGHGKDNISDSGIVLPDLYTASLYIQNLAV